MTKVPSPTDDDSATVARVTQNRWLQMLEENPGHSDWYIQRFKTMAEEGRDLDGEARMIDAMAERGARILDAGCGPGRVGGRLARLGHTVVGVDLDPALIDEARAVHPGATWQVGDLSELHLSDLDRFDVIVNAGNVMTFLDPATRREVLQRMGVHLAPGGRLVVGFGAGRDYPFEEFFADADAAGLDVELRLGTWDLRPFTAESDFLVCVLVARV